MECLIDLLIVMAGNQRIILIDICGTIFHSNTTFDFLDEMINTSFYKKFRKFSKTIIWRIINKLFIISFGKDLTREIAVLSIRGYTKPELYALAETFYNLFLSPRINPVVNDYICTLKQNKDNRLILASATLDFIAEVIANKLEIKDVVATELKYDHLLCSGKIKRDLLGKKDKCLELSGFIPAYDMTITNDFSDIDLIIKSKKCMIVIEKNESKWEKMLDQHHYTNYSFLR